MAYGLNNSPFGLRPVSTLAGGTWSESYVQTYYIRTTPDGLTTYNQNIFKGDLVYWNGVAANNGGGTIAIAGQGDSGPIGTFDHCEYIDTNGLVQMSRYWPASTFVRAGTQIKAFVVSDPNTVFEVQVSSSDNNLANTRFAPTNIGKNANLVLGGGGNVVVNPATGNTVTGFSGYYLDITTLAATETLPLKVIGYSDNQQQASIYTNDNPPQIKPYLTVKVILNVHAYKSVGTLGTVA